MPDRTGTARVGDVDLYWEESGAGPPLVLLMGLGVNCRGWDAQTPALASRFRTVVLDNRGIGRSGKPDGPYRTAQMARDTLALMDALGVARAHVVGISMGGMIAQEVALAAPERVEKLVLCCTYARAERDLVEGAGKGAFGARPEEIADLTREQLFERMLPYLFTPAFIERERANFGDRFAPMWKGFSMRGFLGQMGAVFTHDALDRLGAVRAPTLVMTGTADRLVAPRHSDTLAAAIPGARLRRFDGASHGFNFEIPDEFNAAVLDFLT